MSEKKTAFCVFLMIGSVTLGLSIGALAGHYGIHTWARLAIGYGIFSALAIGAALGTLIGGRDD